MEKFGKMATYQTNLITQFLFKHETFILTTDENKLTIQTFFETINNDFNLPSYKIEEIIEKFLKKPNNSLSYYTIFTIIYKHEQTFESLMDSNKLKNLLNKYNNVTLNLPFETSAQAASLANYLCNNLIKKKSDNFVHSMNSNDMFNMLKIIIPYSTVHVKQLISNSNMFDLFGEEYYDQIINDNFNIQPYVQSDIEPDQWKMLTENDILLAKVFKLLIQTFDNKENNIDQLLTFLYCRQDIVRLNIIKQFRPELLSVNMIQLIKIIFYGRNKSLQFVIDNVPNQFKQITEEHNVFDILLLSDDTKINYIKDIWNGLNWYNDECEKPHIGNSDFDKVFELMRLNTTENTVSIFDNTVIRLWLKERVLHYTDHHAYFIEKTKLMSMLNLDMTTKEGIIYAIDTIGHESVWRILAKKGSGILKVLLG